MKKMTNAWQRAGVLISVLYFLLASAFMFNFYQCLSGFIANKFEEPLVMLPIVSSYLLPVACFLYRFYAFYVKTPGRVARGVFGVLTALWAAGNLALIFVNFPLYASNHALGVYKGLVGLGYAFPYDGIASAVLILLLRGFSVYLAAAKPPFADRAKEWHRRGACSVHPAEYAAISILAVFALVFIGAAMGAHRAIGNLFYDGRFLFLLAWVTVMPLGNLFCLVFKPHRWVKGKGKRAAVLLGGVVFNLLFAVLLGVCEGTSPGFIIHIGKPLFTVAFSVSLPIEMLVLLGIMGISSVAYLIKLACVCFCRKEAE